MTLTLCLAGTAAGSIKDTITKSFSVEPGGTLDIDTRRGSIGVVAETGNTVEVEIIREVKTSNEKKPKKCWINSLSNLTPGK